MGVYFENMKKPVQCISCPMWTLTYVHAINAVDICNQQKRAIDNPYFVPDWCPAKELPPHGKLIDADALMDAGPDIVSEWGDECGYSTERINAAPTIIPAEPKEES